MKVLKRKNLNKLLDKAKVKYKLIAPSKKFWSDILFEELDSIEELTEDYVLPCNSLKDFFLPQSEILLPERKFKKDKKMLFFGVRPCDIKAVNFQDLFFSKKPEDFYYLTKRQNSLIISVTCNMPLKSCFCLFTHTGPYLESQDNFDLQFTCLEDEYFIDVGSKKGEEFILTFKEFFSESNNLQLNKTNQLHKKCKMIMEEVYDVGKVEKKLTDGSLNGFWEELGLRCTNCGGCEFICPTCFCFNLQDYTRNKETIRIRSWDSCTYEGYSRLSGGFNPCYRRGDRIKKRFYCKLYHSKIWTEMYACVGCGRCSCVCPVNLEMESFISSIIKGNTYSSLLKEL